MADRLDEIRDRILDSWFGLQLRARCSPYFSDALHPAFAKSAVWPVANDAALIHARRHLSLFANRRAASISGLVSQAA